MQYELSFLVLFMQPVDINLVGATYMPQRGISPSSNDLLAGFIVLKEVHLHLTTHGNVKEVKDRESLGSH